MINIFLGKNITVELIMSCLGGFLSDILLREKIATTVCSEYDIFWYDYTIQKTSAIVTLMKSFVYWSESALS